MMLRVLFFFLFLLPLAFQIVYGIKAIKGHVKLKLWQVSVFSCIAQVVITLFNSYLMAVIIKQAESHDALPMVGVVALNIVFGILILLVILIQSIVQFRLAKRNNLRG